MRVHRPWTTGEARRLSYLRAKRVRVADIARLLGRTEHAIYSFLRYVPATPERRPERQPIARRGWKPKPSPSERLRVATLIAIAAYANNNGLHIDAAANRLLMGRR